MRTVVLGNATTAAIRPDFLRVNYLILWQRHWIDPIPNCLIKDAYRWAAYQPEAPKLS